MDQAVVGVSRDIVQGKVYAVRLPYEGIAVKRLFLYQGSREFVLKSDNEKYPEERIAFDSGDSFIYGQVLWVLQSYEKLII